LKHDIHKVFSGGQLTDKVPMLDTGVIKDADGVAAVAGVHD